MAHAADILRYKTLPSALTAHDLLKALAIVLMFADHVGYFLFPDEMWFRVAGRFSAPIWFFLIGHAETRAIPRSFWIAGALVWFSTIAAGEYMFPVTVIATLIAARLSIDWIMVRALRSREALAGMFFLLFFMGIPTLIFFEYGTSIFLFSMVGYMVAHRKRFQIPVSVLLAFTAASAFSHVLIQGALMPSLATDQFLTLCAGMAVLGGVFLVFRLVVLPWSVPAVLRQPIQFLGRRTLEIYVMHLIALRGLLMVLRPQDYAFMDFEWFAFRHLLQMFL